MELRARLSGAAPLVGACPCQRKRGRCCQDISDWPVGIVILRAGVKSKGGCFPSLKIMGKEVEEGLWSRWMLAGRAWVVSRGSWLHSLFTQDFVVQEAFRADPVLCVRSVR